MGEHGSATAFEGANERGEKRPTKRDFASFNLKNRLDDIERFMRDGLPGSGQDYERAGDIAIATGSDYALKAVEMAKKSSNTRFRGEIKELLRDLHAIEAGNEEVINRYYAIEMGERERRGGP